MDYTIFDSEFKLMEILWELKSVNSTELVKVCNERLGWKKSTTYTTIRRLAERKIIQNEHATVSPLVAREEVAIEESKKLLDKLYQGSLNMLVAGFLKKEELTEDELNELKEMIDQELKER